jgi:hypothetical protein
MATCDLNLHLFTSKAVVRRVTSWQKQELLLQIRKIKNRRVRQVRPETEQRAIGSNARAIAWQNEAAFAALSRLEHSFFGAARGI